MSYFGTHDDPILIPNFISDGFGVDEKESIEDDLATAVTKMREKVR